MITKRTFEEHLDPKIGPKRILALDGGGIRGALSLGYLKRIEETLRDIHGDKTLRLCDYFDLIGGTSTGSIIAAGLAIGMEVEDLRELYMKLGGKIFGEKRNWWNPFETAKFLKASYDYKGLADNLKKAFGTIPMGSDKILTGLCIVAKRADTNSTWPLINHPKGKYYSSKDGDNKSIPLWQAVRASSAAPTYFVPQLIDVGHGQQAAFVDGGVSMANNPALTLLMVATAKGFPFHWEMGEDKIQLVSVGTGYSVFSKLVGEIEDAWLGDWAQNVPNMLMQDSSWQNQTILQWISNSPTALEIDGELGDLGLDYMAGTPLIQYLRYSQRMTKQDLNDLGIKKYSDKEVKDLIKMDNADSRFELYKVGYAAGKVIQKSHFASPSTQSS